MPLALTLALTLACASGPTSPGNTRSGPPSVERTFEHVLTEHDVQGVALVAQRGEILFSGGRGFADRERSVPNADTTGFRLGSVTKQFTAMAVLLLQDEGLLTVTDTVGRFLPEVPELWRGLTLHQLLSHTSGLMHSWSLPGFAATMAEPTTLPETLERFYDQPLLFEPGTAMAYSGVGYFLLARVIERVGGKSYDEFIAERIFTPLGMARSRGENPESPGHHQATAYVRTAEGGVDPAPEIFLPLLTGGGNLVSTAADMALWGEAIRERRLLGEEGYTRYFEPVLNGFAYGWIHGTVDGARMIWHSGGTPGTNTYVMIVPAVDLWVVVLANLEPTPVAQIAADLARIVLGDSGSGGR